MGIWIGFLIDGMTIQDILGGGVTATANLGFHNSSLIKRVKKNIIVYCLVIPKLLLLTKCYYKYCKRH